MSEKAKHKPLSLPLILLALLAAVVVLVVITIAIATVGTYFSMTSYELEGNEAREFILGHFPSLPLPEASDFYLYYFSESEVYIRFSLDPESLDAWRRDSTLCFEDLSHTSPLYNTSGEVLAWWQPSGNLLNSDCQSLSETSYELAINQSNSDLFIVYLAIFQPINP